MTSINSIVGKNEDNDREIFCAQTKRLSFVYESLGLALHDDTLANFSPSHTNEATPKLSSALHNEDAYVGMWLQNVHMCVAIERDAAPYATT